MASSFESNGGLKLFFVQAFPFDVGGINCSQGSAVRGSLGGVFIAHKFGHACGLQDIYESRTFRIPGQPQDIQVKVPDDAVPTSDKMPLDWNNGPGTQYYPVRTWYGSGSTLHRQFVKKLMMLGNLSSTSIQVDLSSGPVFGVYYTPETTPDGAQYKHYRLGMVSVGLDAMNRQPSHE